LTAEAVMSVTQYYYRLNDDAVRHFRDDGETFDDKKYPDSGHLTIRGEECLLLSDLAARAKNPAAPNKLLSDVIAGFAGEPVYGNNNYPYLIDRETVALASRMMSEIRHEELRNACDLNRLKRYNEVEDWLWEAWGPNVLEDRLIPEFEALRTFLCQAAERNQHVIAGWF
jgi:hypothetical protein